MAEVKGRALGIATARTGITSGMLIWVSNLLALGGPGPAAVASHLAWVAAMILLNCAMACCVVLLGWNAVALAQDSEERDERRALRQARAGERREMLAMMPRRKVMNPQGTLDLHWVIRKAEEAGTVSVNGRRYAGPPGERGVHVTSCYACGEGPFRYYGSTPGGRYLCSSCRMGI